MTMKIRVLMFCLVCLGLQVSTTLAVEDQAAWVSSGKLGGAVSLNGDQCLVGVDAGEFDSLTLSLWLKPGDQVQGETSIFSCFNWQEGALHLLLVEQGHLLLCMNATIPKRPRLKVH